jgi:cyclopropane-fatty-acyl-phospholipid synthase
LLKTNGLACIQTITIDDSLFDQYIKSTDFIQQYIFPGGCLPSPSQFKLLAKQHGLDVVDEFCFGLDYANTLKQWRTLFKAQEHKVRQLGFDDAFIKTWEFYLCYCEAGFTHHNLDVIQFTLKKTEV